MTGTIKRGEYLLLANQMSEWFLFFFFFFIVVVVLFFLGDIVVGLNFIDLKFEMASDKRFQF